MGGKRKTNSEFIKEVHYLVGNEYSVLGEYVTTCVKILMKHNTCNHEYYVTPNHFLKGRRCPKCYGTHKKTTEAFAKEICELTKYEYKVLGEYVNNCTKILIKHNKCGYEYKVLPNGFLRGSRCPKCYENTKRTTERFRKEIYDLVKDEYSVLDEYINNRTNIKIKHNLCGHIYKVNPSSFLRNHRCPKCAGNVKKNLKEFKEDVYRLVENEYTVLGEYVNSNTKLKMKHNLCGCEYYVRPYNFLSGYRCPKCAESKGEKAISLILDKYNIIYQREKEFNDLFGLGGKPLRFDFAIYKDNKLFLLIEYQGEFHDGSSGGYSKINLEKQREHDIRKREYAEKNNINFLEIWYRDFDNIEEILVEKLKQIVMNK